jgi:phage tail-like protein
MGGGECMRRKIVFAILAVLTVIFVSSQLVVAPEGYRKEPLPSSNFIVEIDGIVSSSFLSVDGLHAEAEVVEYREGGDNNNIKVTPGNVRHGPLTLKRILTTDDELYLWFKDTRDGNVDRKSMSVIFMDHGRSEQVRFNLHECWPSEYYIEPVSSSPSDVVVEVIVIQYELLEWA